jgi:cation:H+ antiporter
MVPARVARDPADVVRPPVEVIHLLALLVGLALLVAGAEATVRGARSLGLRIGLSPVIVGLTIVAYGTSTPELVVSTAATLEGQDGIALGNVVGSNICNVLLILGVCALVRPMEIHTRVLRVEAPLLVVASALALGLLALGQFGRFAGVVLVTGLVVYTILTVRIARAESAEVEAEIAEAQPAASERLWLDLGLTSLGLALLIAGGTIFVRGASGSAAALGIPPAIVGLTLVAVGTSLPELAASLFASLRGQGDIAIGNVVGSNLFNLLGVLGMAAIVDPISPIGVGWRDLGVMLASAAVLFIFLHTRRRLERWEGVTFLVAYAVYLYAIVR